MLTEQELIAYLENTLSSAERERVEAELERDPQLRRELVRQSQMEHALRAALGSEAANQRVKESVLAVIRGEREESLKSQILADTADTPTHPSVWEWLAGLVRRPAFSLSVAAALVLFVVWFAQHPATPTVGIELPSQVALAGAISQPKLGDTIRAETSSSATVKFTDGTTLHLEPGTEISLVAVGNSQRTGGKQLKLLAGSLSADVAKQPAGLPLLIQTPHAFVTVVGTEFDLSVATNQTALEVTRGLVEMKHDTNVVDVAAGEFAVAAPAAPMRYGRLPRNPFLWPFSSGSIWNRPLGSGTQFVPAPGRPFLADGPLEHAVRPRRPFLGSASDPLRRIWVNGEVRADVRLGDASLSLAGKADSVVLLQHARRYAFELRGVTVRADGDLEAGDMERVWLNGPGTFERSTPAVPYGLSSLGGLLRAGELETGIRHALSARVSRERLGGRDDFKAPSTVWPAVGGDQASAEFLNVGTLLAIPPAVDISAKVGTNGPAYELARAMQDYGVYITGVGDAPFLLLADTSQSPEADAWLTQLIPLLQAVKNNTLQTPGGGGAPRREIAPALPGESASDRL